MAVPSKAQDAAGARKHRCVAGPAGDSSRRPLRSSVAAAVRHQYAFLAEASISPGGWSGGAGARRRSASLRKRRWEAAITLGRGVGGCVARLKGGVLHQQHLPAGAPHARSAAQLPAAAPPPDVQVTAASHLRQRCRQASVHFAETLLRGSMQGRASSPAHRCAVPCARCDARHFDPGDSRRGERGDEGWGAGCSGRRPPALPGHSRHKQCDHRATILSWLTLSTRCQNTAT